MTETREIITVQLGHYSNFVGAHWWNIQESSFCYDHKATEKLLINHDVLFREGMTPRSEVSYTPRLIAVDLKGSLGSLRREGVLYDSPQQHLTPNWSGRVNVLKTESEKRNEFLEDMDKAELTLHPERQLLFDEDKDVCSDRKPRSELQSPVLNPREKLYNLNSSVRVWSDFLRQHLHPRSVFLLDSFFHDNQPETFDLYGTGLQAYNEEKTRDELEDICRRNAEECSYLQGFNVLLDSHDGFAGLGSGFLQHIQDEYGNKMVSCFPLCQAGYGAIASNSISEVNRRLNFLFCLESVSQRCDMFTVLNVGNGTVESEQRSIQFPHVSYQQALAYHTSSILATWMDNTTMSLRMKSNPTSMKEQSEFLTPSGRNGLTASLGIPFPMRKDVALSEVLLSQDQIPLFSLTPHSNQTVDSIVQSLTLTGIPVNKFYTENLSSHQKTPIEELLVKNLKQSWPSQLNSVKLIGCPCHVSSPFPHIFQDKIGRDGFLLEAHRPSFRGVESVPLLSGLHNGDSMTNMLLKTVRSVTLLKGAKIDPFYDAGVEKDDLEETLNNLKDFAERYDCDLFKG